MDVHIAMCLGVYVLLAQVTQPNHPNVAEKAREVHRIVTSAVEIASCNNVVLMFPRTMDWRLVPSLVSPVGTSPTALALARAFCEADKIVQEIVADLDRIEEASQETVSDC